MRPYYYRILEIEMDASDAEVRSAYRRLAKKWHPDVNHSPGAKEHFLLIQKAWQTLGDPQLRANYDFYSVRYTHRSGDPARASTKRPYANPDVRTRAYSGFGGRVFYRSADQQTLDKEEKIRNRDIAAGVIAIVVILLIPFIGKYWNSGALWLNGVDTTAEIVAFDVSLTYSYNVDGNIVYAEKYPGLYRYGNDVMMPDGMPLKTGDRFRVRFMPKRIRYNKLYLDNPDSETIERYCTLIYLRLHSSRFLDSLADGSMKAVFVYTLCDSLYHNFGTRGLANLYFAQTPADVNVHNNARTFSKMSTKKAFRRILTNTRDATRPVSTE